MNDFTKYVDAYCKKHGVSVEEALTHEMVKEVSVYYGGEKYDARTDKGDC